MAETCQGFVSATKDGERVIWDETKRDGGHRLEGTEVKVVASIRLCLGDDVMYHVKDEESPVAVWLKLESRYMSKSLTNKLYLK